MSLEAVLVVHALWLEQGPVKAAHQVLACPVPAEAPWVHFLSQVVLLRLIQVTAL